ncbi:hypothetical protein DPEC_G00335750 [Dallia pectoralis]|uniref:Uncharacterized protein n=1 Tax=Dallia pectoralis TaxID=75939 RepID=A0ACC2F721_DALPE|nr:hypothetical protein DPEC_G00335750 [Dallia pectoralis]
MPRRLKPQTDCQRAARARKPTCFALNIAQDCSPGSCEKHSGLRRGPLESGSGVWEIGASDRLLFGLRAGDTRSTGALNRPEAADKPGTPALNELQVTAAIAGGHTDTGG